MKNSISFEIIVDLKCRDLGFSEYYVGSNYANWIMLRLFAKGINNEGLTILDSLTQSSYIGHQYYENNSNLYFGEYKVIDTLIYEYGVVYNENQLNLCINFVDIMIQKLGEFPFELLDKYGGKDGINLILDTGILDNDAGIAAIEGRTHNFFYDNEYNIQLLTDFRDKILKKSIEFKIPHLLYFE